jgi:ferric-dicitrate binding protein FerR (iron transport regulator)
MKEEFKYERLKEFWEGKLSPENAEAVRRFLSDPANREELSSFMQFLWQENHKHPVEEEFESLSVLGNIHKIISRKRERIQKKTSVSIHWRYAAIILVGLAWEIDFFCPLFYQVREKGHLFKRCRREKTSYLPDGSHVWLNSNSSVSYKENFLTAKRKVELHGEAFFEVTANKEKPFEVECGPIEIIVTGTRFNVTAYPSENRIITTLTEGKILLNTKEQKPVALLPGQQAIFEKKEKLLTIKINVPAERITSWKDNKLVFRNEPLQSVFESLGHWYGVTFDVADSSLLAMHYTVTVTDEPLDEILSLLSHTIDIKYTISQGHVIVSRKQ